MADQPLDLSTALRTNPAARSFTNRSIDESTLFRILDTARFAPSGGNKQGWHVLIVKDLAIRSEIGRLSREVWSEYAAMTAAGQRPFAADLSGHWPGSGDVDLAKARAANAPWHFDEHLADVPVLLVVAVDLTVLAAMDTELDRVGLAAGGSIYPFVQNILLAARGEGLGGVMTTFLVRREPEAKALLNLPAQFAIAALVMIGEPNKQLTKLTRRPVTSFTTIDRFDGPVFNGTIT